MNKLLPGIPALLLLVSIIEAAPPNDTCEYPAPIEGQGVFAFDNTDATYEGFLPSDVWYCWTSPFTGTVSIDTCSGTTVDTYLTVHEGCGCPRRYDDGVVLSDDSCVTQSRGSFDALAGQEYLLEIGTKFGAVRGGPGSIFIDYGPALSWSEAPVSCTVSRETCQPPDRWHVSTSDRLGAVTADNFVPAVAGSVTQLCWWGTYVNDLGDWGDVAIDAFEVRYYANDGGLPGKLIAGPFSQASGGLAVYGPVLEPGLFPDGQRAYGFSASHEPVSVQDGECYWLEITNASLFSSQWQWAHALSGDRQSLLDGGNESSPDGFDRFDLTNGDMAFCLDIQLSEEYGCFAPPDHDSCIASRYIEEGLIPIDTAGATTNGPTVPLIGGHVPPVCGFPLGDDQMHNDVWYDFVAPCSGLLTISLCESDFDTKIAVYPFGDCADLGDPIACNDDACGDDPGYPSVLSVPLDEAAELLIRIGGYDGAFGQGVIELDFAIAPPTFADLSTFAEFASCFTGACAAQPCDLLPDSSSCCHAQDFDADGDVDAEDLTGFMAILSGPPQKMTIAAPDERPFVDESNTAPILRDDRSFLVPAAIGTSGP